MTTPVEKLSKILRLEAEKYQDRAVFGGLARYTDTWLQEAGAAFGPEAAGWVQEVSDRLRAYSSHPDDAARQEAVTALLDTLQAAPPLRAPRREEERQQPPPAPPAPARVRPVPAAPAPLKARPASTVPAPARSRTGLDSPVIALQGVGPRQAERLAWAERHARQPANDGERKLLWVLRADLGLTGTKFGCGRGYCGPAPSSWETARFAPYPRHLWEAGYGPSAAGNPVAFHGCCCHYFSSLVSYRN